MKWAARNVANHVVFMNGGVIVEQGAGGRVRALRKPKAARILGMAQQKE